MNKLVNVSLMAASLFTGVLRINAAQRTVKIDRKERGVVTTVAALLQSKDRATVTNSIGDRLNQLVQTKDGKNKFVYLQTPISSDKTRKAIQQWIGKHSALETANLFVGVGVGNVIPQWITDNPSLAVLVSDPRGQSDLLDRRLNSWRGKMHSEAAIDQFLSDALKASQDYNQARAVADGALTAIEKHVWERH